MFENQITNDALNQVQHEISKAAETIATNTFSPGTRSIHSPENLDEKIKLVVPLNAGAILRGRLGRVPGFGQAAAWKKMTSKLHSSVADGGNATVMSFADAGSPSETSQTYSSASATYKLLGRKLEVGGLHLAASRGRAGQPDVQVDREALKMIEVILGEEEMIIHGDTDNEANGFDGILKQITTNSGTVTFLTASGIQTHAKTIYDAGSSPTLLMANSAQGQHLANNLEGSGSIQRTMIDNQGSAVGGFALSSIVNNIDGSKFDFRTSRYVDKTALLLTETDPKIGNVIEMDDLIPLSRVDVPSTSFSFVSFILEATVCKVFAENWQVQLTTGT